jgi:hypothetical protein
LSTSRSARENHGLKGQQPDDDEAGQFVADAHKAVQAKHKPRMPVRFRGRFVVQQRHSGEPKGPNAAKNSHHEDRCLDRITRKHAASHKIANSYEPITKTRFLASGGSVHRSCK